LLPFTVKSFSDFYASPYHARTGQFPAWWCQPLGYNSRASSVCVSGESVQRPLGQFISESGKPIFAPCDALDFELEVGIVLGPGNKQGHRIPLEEADKHIFGYVLLNDWSARDIQSWEMRPLGPFLGKSFCTTISPWVIPKDALLPFRLDKEAQEPEPLPYLRHEGQVPSYDIQLEAHITPENGQSELVCRSNFHYLHWTPEQMVASHASNGCPLLPGDLLGTGTISGPEQDARGCMAEWPRVGKTMGARPWLLDGDTVTLSAYCEREGLVIDFGTCEGTIQPAEEGFS